MREKLTVIKVGGKIVEEEATLNRLLDDFATIEGHKVLVHGGGRSATKIAAQLGIESKMVNGRRITDSETLKVVTMVYGGLVNKNVVAGLQARGVNALGLTGADMNVMRSVKRPVKEVDYGFVGDVEKVDASLLSDLIYKGVVPASLGTDALGGAINIITKQEKKNYLDVSYGIGSFHTHKADLNAQFVEPKTGLIIRPTVGVNYSKNDYRMKDVQMRDESGDNFIYGNPKRFHDDYFSLLGQIEVGVANKSWADAFFVSASYSKTDKELQTGSVQDKVYGMAEKNSDAWNISAHYQKRNFILKNMQLNAALSQTCDHSLTVDTTYRKYYWDGGYIDGQRNEIMGKEQSMRHYKRPLTVVRANLDYKLNNHHNFNLNYHLSRTGNDRYDDLDTTFEPSNDVVTKHILGFSYNQSLLDGKMENVFFIKDYINHPNTLFLIILKQCSNAIVLPPFTSNTAFC